MSVISKGGYREVRKAVDGVESTKLDHRLQAHGIVDGDGMSGDPEGTDSCVYRLPVYSVEGLLYDPHIIRKVALQQFNVVNGFSADEKYDAALDAGLNAIKEIAQNLSRKGSLKQVEKRVWEQIPASGKLLDKDSLSICVSGEEIVSERNQALNDAVAEKNWALVTTLCPVHNSPAPDAIARALGLRDKATYVKMVHRLLREDISALEHIRSQCGNLYDCTGVLAGATSPQQIRVPETAPAKGLTHGATQIRESDDLSKFNKNALAKRGALFEKEFNVLQQSENAYGFRISAVPVGNDVRVDRVFSGPAGLVDGLAPPGIEINLDLGNGKKTEIVGLRDIHRVSRTGWTPRLRAVRSAREYPDIPAVYFGYLEIHCDGLVEFGWLCQAGLQEFLASYEAIREMASVICWADTLRQFSRNETAEYAVQFAMHVTGGAVQMRAGPGNQSNRNPAGILARGVTPLPIYIFSALAACGLNDFSA